MLKENRPSYLNFDPENYPWQPDLDYKKHPEKYRVGKGEQGVLICEPYKSEILPYWRFKTEEIAKESSKIIFAMFENYIRQNDFVGADMARKYLQMGYTRARRYANYKGGKKFDKDENYKQLQRGTGETEKGKAAAVFYRKYKLAEANPIYKKRKADCKKKLS